MVLSSLSYCYFLLLTQLLGHPNGRTQFNEIMYALLGGKSDNNCSVQEAAISALATLEEVTYLSSLGLLFVELETYSFMFSGGCNPSRGY